MKIRPLICAPSPRDIEQVIDARATLPYDQLFAKYMNMDDAYTRLRAEFIRRKEYTHFVFAPDDLVVEPVNMERLLSVLRKHNYPILSGVCNVDTTHLDRFWAIAHNLPEPRHLDGKRYYSFFHEDEHDPKNPIVNVPWSGFPLMAIRRDVIEAIELEGDRRWNDNSPTSSSWDVVFCYKCKQAGIPVHADTSNRMLHLRHGGEIFVGKKRPRMLLWKYRKRDDSFVEEEIRQEFTEEQRADYLSRFNTPPEVLFPI